MHAAVLRYRVMAYITGVLIIVVCFIGVPLQFAAGKPWIDNTIGTLHGFLYIIYVIFAYLLAQKLRVTRKQTVIMMLAGTIPVMTFVVERWVNRSFIIPALATESAAAAAQQPVGR
jgi:integral membrane protein